MSGGPLPEPLRPLVTRPAPWLDAPPIDETAFREVRADAIFDCCKWDPQVGDTDVLARTPLVLPAATWSELATLAESLATETLIAEREILAHPRVLDRLGLPGALVRAFRRTDRATAPFRVMRFDFHATAEGWRISEVNSDVPGGLIEAGGFSRLLARRRPELAPVGDPVAAIVEACRARLPVGARIGLVHATAYTDDRQVMIHLGRALERAGLHTRLIGPDSVRWIDRIAHVHDDGGGPHALDALFRFYPAEWLPNLGWFSAWRRFVHGSDTPAINPPHALVSQSKRFPLACSALGLRLPTWEKLLPDTRDPREVDLYSDAWVLKPALGRVGEDIALAGATEPNALARLRRHAKQYPRLWAAQQRFVALPWHTADGERFPCIGVYVIDGRAAGAYGRAAARPLVDSSSQDIAVLIAPPDPASPS